MLSGEGSRVSAAVSFFAGDEFGISAFATGLAKIFFDGNNFLFDNGQGVLRFRCLRGREYRR